MASCFQLHKSAAFAHNVILDESPGSADEPKHILVVMDGLKELSVDLLEWVLKNFTFGLCVRITLLGITPWLNIPLSSKTWSDIWTMNLEDLSTFLEKNELKNDARYIKVQRLIQLCQKYRVVPEIRTEMGHPIRLLVVEQISSLHATLVVFDRHHEKKYIGFYAEKIPCSIVVMNDKGEIHLIKKRKCGNTVGTSTPLQYTPTLAAAEESHNSPSSSTTPSTLIVGTCSKLKKYLKPKTQPS